MNSWFGVSTRDRRGSYWRGAGFSPRWRISNQWFLSYNLDLKFSTDGYGYANYDTLGNPIFGKRNQTTITNSLHSTYIFGEELESEIRMRYYRSALEYFEFFDLAADGELTPSSYDADLNTVFGVFTIDANLTWRFSPGSELVATWKNTIYTSGMDPAISYLDDVRNLPAQNQDNRISLKVLYYLDAWDLRHHF